MYKEVITIIIPVFNLVDKLKYCIESIKKQTYPPHLLQIILVDDGSTDGSAELCDELAMADQSVIVFHQKNKGPGIARNTGLDNATGQYIMFIDGDDYLHTDCIKLLYDAINSKERYDISMCNRIETDNYTENTQIKCDTKVTELTAHNMILNLFYHKDCVFFYFLWNKLYRKSLIENIHFGPYYRAEDFDFNFRVLLKANKIVWVHSALYFYVRSKDSLSLQRNWELHYLNTLDILDKNIKNLPQDKLFYRHELLMRLYRCMQRLIMINYKSSKRVKTIELCRKYEQKNRKWYWTDVRFSLREKIKTTIKVRYPQIVEKLNKMRNFICSHI